MTRSWPSRLSRILSWEPAKRNTTRKTKLCKLRKRERKSLKKVNLSRFNRKNNRNLKFLNLIDNSQLSNPKRQSSRPQFLRITPSLSKSLVLRARKTCTASKKSMSSSREARIRATICLRLPMGTNHHSRQLFWKVSISTTWRSFSNWWVMGSCRRERDRMTQRTRISRNNSTHSCNRCSLTIKLMRRTLMMRNSEIICSNTG